MKRMPRESTRQVTRPGDNGHQDDPNWYVDIKGDLVGRGKGLTEHAAHQAAEQNYDDCRASLVREPQGTREELIETVASVLYSYHHAVVVNHGRGFPPGTPLPHAAPASTMNHFRREAEIWLHKVETWPQQESAPEQVRGQERGGAFV